MDKCRSWWPRIRNKWMVGANSPRMNSWKQSTGDRSADELNWTSGQLFTSNLSMQQYSCCGWDWPVIRGEPSEYSLIEKSLWRNHFDGHYKGANLSHYWMTSLSEFWGEIRHIIQADSMVWTLWPWYKHQNAQGSCTYVIETPETLGN